MRMPTLDYDPHDEKDWAFASLKGIIPFLPGKFQFTLCLRSGDVAQNFY